MERRDSQVPGVERRVIVTPSLRLERRDGEADKPRMVGHAAVFNSWTTLYEGRYFVWREKVNPGAFKRAIAEKQDVRSVFNHDPNWVLGRTASGTLALSEDKTGLLTDTDPPTTQLIRDLVLAPIDRGDVSQMSFAFLVKRNASPVVTTIDGVTVVDRGGERITIRMEDDVEIEERELIDLDLFDVSPVTYPAYDDTDVGLRTRGLGREAEVRDRIAKAPALRRAEVLANTRRRLWLANALPSKGNL